MLTGKSWDEFCDMLKAAGASLQAPGAPRDAFNQAEGYRYLARLARVRGRGSRVPPSAFPGQSLSGVVFDRVEQGKRHQCR